MFDAFQRGYMEQIQGTIFETLIQPALFHLGLMDWSEDIFDGVEFRAFTRGSARVGLAYILFRPPRNYGDRWNRMGRAARGAAPISSTR